MGKEPDPKRIRSESRDAVKRRDHYAFVAMKLRVENTDPPSTTSGDGERGIVVSRWSQDEALKARQ